VNGPPILVTGSHRSGSTWVGSILSLAEEVGYIHEPFNTRRRPGICRARFDRWFTYVPAEGGEELEADFGRMLAWRYSFGRDIATARNIRDIRRTVIDGGRFVRNRLRHARPLLKDPIALFSTEWLVARFGVQPVILVRHPAGFASSLKRLGWTFDFRDLTAQPELMQSYLAPFAPELRWRVDDPGDIVDQAILLWRVMYSVVARFRDEHPDWQVVRHEDLVRDPIDSYRALYETLGLTFTASVAARIVEPRDGDAAAGRGDVPSWKRWLPGDDVARIRGGVADVSAQFYTPDEW
jgi:hypothetical protein